MKIVFFGTSENSVILLEGIAPHFEVAGIVTMPDAPVGRKQILTPSLVAQFAASSEALKDATIFKPANLKDDGFMNDIKALEADLFIVLSYGKILPAEVINIPPLKTINVHPSLLPLYRGATPMQTALLNGETVTGNTIIVMDEEMDHGPILAQRQIDIEPAETYPELETRLASEAVELILEVVPAYAEDRLIPKEQDHTAATLTKYIAKADGQVDWNDSAEKTFNKFRAFFRWPGIWTTWDGEVIKILDCRVRGEQTTTAPGTVLEGGYVSCGGGTILEIILLQRAGKNPATIKDFLNGNKNFVGSKLS